MLYVRNCLIALIAPWGRLSAGPFAVMALLLILAHCAIQMHITDLADDLPPYNTWSMSLFVLMWMGFCISSRRFHDSGKTAFFLVPALVVMFAAYLAVFDDLHLANSAFEEDRDVLRWAERARLVFQILSLVAMGAALMRPGDVGENAFGDEFYDNKSTKKAATRLATHAPAAASRKAPAPLADVQPAAKRQEFLAGGPRGRITPGESARHRPDGFGRR
jgi:uncharacterized membrane protein YhaH (DUF805 family)